MLLDPEGPTQVYSLFIKKNWKVFPIQYAHYTEQDHET